MDAFGIGGINIDLHFVTANTKLLGISDRHRPVESAHKRDARDKKENGHDTYRHRAWLSDCPPVSSEECPDATHKLLLFCNQPVTEYQRALDSETCPRGMSRSVNAADHLCPTSAAARLQAFFFCFRSKKFQKGAFLNLLNRANKSRLVRLNRATQPFRQS